MCLSLEALFVICLFDLAEGTLHLVVVGGGALFCFVFVQ